MNPDEFLDASNWASEFVELLYFVDDCQRRGDRLTAERCFKSARILGKLFHDTLSTYKEQIAAEAEGDIGFVSAHDAAVHYWAIVELTKNRPGWSMPPSVCNWLEIDTEKIGNHLFRERQRILEKLPSLADDPRWRRQSVLIERTGKQFGKTNDQRKQKMSELCKKGVLQTNNKSGHDCRVDLISFIEYCEANGYAYNVPKDYAPPPKK